MEFVSSRISINPQVSPAIPLLTWKTRRIPSTLTISNSKRLPSQPSFSLYLFRSIPSRKFQISAHFGRTCSRQNYLRKKLTQLQRQQQVSENLVHEFDDHESNFDSSSERTLNLEKSSSVNDESFDNNTEDSKNIDDNFSHNAGVKESENELRKKKIGESSMWNKLESWVEQYKKDSEFWGIGTGPIFTVFQDAEGKVERVVVNEDEIVRRSRVDPQLEDETEDLAEVNFKMSFAKDLAREMEKGSNVIPKHSSVAKFLQSDAEESHVREAIRNVTLKPVSFPSMSRVGVLVFCGFSVIWAIRRLLTVGNDSEEYTSLEKEMLRRKMKTRKEEEKMVKGSVEVLQDQAEPKGVSFKRPQLDKEVLVNSIIKAKGSNNQLGIVEHATPESELQGKIKEIRAMARDARETERKGSLQKFSSHNAAPGNELPSQKEVYDKDSDETGEYMSPTDTNNDIGLSTNGAPDEKCERQFNIIHNGTKSLRSSVSNEKVVPAYSDLTEENLHSDGPGLQSQNHKNSLRKKLNIIKSAKEAREYLSTKHHIMEVNQKDDVGNDEHCDSSCWLPTANVAFGSSNQIVDLTEKVYEPPPTSGKEDFSYPSEDYGRVNEAAEGNKDSLNDSETSRISSGHEDGISNNGSEIPIDKIPRKQEIDIQTSQNCNSKSDTSSILGDLQNSKSTEIYTGGQLQTEKVPTELKNHKSEDTTKNETPIGLQEPVVAATNEVKDRTAELAKSVNKENWIEKNFHEFEPIVEKIGVGFRDSYHLAREKASQELGSEVDLAQLKSDDAENELEWMKNERLREIVFKVRDNEQSGRDPFHLMDEEDKHAFFSGLEKKVEQENKKLLKLHEYFHSNIENLDYGADGISLYDPPEKIIPRWKVPPAETNPEFLNNFKEQRKGLVAESLKNSFLSRKTAKEAVDKSEKLYSLENGTAAADDSDSRKEIQKDNLASSKTIIESSDGSVRTGKRSGKEFWQHTKKWSEGFLESYNAETDPDIKATMRDMGKDLDRWITEKEVKEAAELMERLPEKGFIKQKLNKVRREMDLYGPQAVVSKYREYAEEKEEDYLWWLDLPHVLCIELYTVEDGEQRVGFYSLEMAADLELDPKQYHVIAFEDAGDCKNLCYIIQAKMEVLGNGNAFVVARPPKDAFREAKANGFSVTVIRKGQLQLNVDQTMEEVEESIAEIGSKIYHDRITKERSVDVNGLMKGVFGVTKPTKRKRSKRKPKRRIKP
ncbi:hypothetical protein C2S51_038544 [Perilla frutescens var. frutescens]|nr:hypothetical protein C2S51_038544 [Perilla frutescens var. frutescens]